MARFTVEMNDDLSMEFRIKAVRRRLKLNRAFEEAVKLWLEKS